MVTLHVAINSELHMLTSLLISNQFIELKTCVHKRYDIKRVMFMLCNDMIERFQVFIVAFVVCTKNLQELRFDVTASRFQWTIFAAAWYVIFYICLKFQSDKFNDFCAMIIVVTLQSN